MPADTVIWPIQFTLADNELPTLFTTLDAQTQQVMQFLAQQGIDTQSISISAPAVIDKKPSNTVAKRGLNTAISRRKP